MAVKSLSTASYLQNQHQYKYLYGLGRRGVNGTMDWKLGIVTENQSEEKKEKMRSKLSLLLYYILPLGKL
jgi:hypothetical protein